MKDKRDSIARCLRCSRMEMNLDAAVPHFIDFLFKQYPATPQLIKAADVVYGFHKGGHKA